MRASSIAGLQRTGVFIPNESQGSRSKILLGEIIVLIHNKKKIFSWDYDVEKKDRARNTWDRLAEKRKGKERGNGT